MKVVFGPVAQVVLSKSGVPPRMPSWARAKVKRATMGRTNSMNILSSSEIVRKMSRISISKLVMNEKANAQAE